MTRLTISISFFRLADEGEKGIGGGFTPTFPGMTFVRSITELADSFQMMPSEMYKKYTENPKDILLILSWRKYKANREAKAAEQARNKKQKF